MNSLKLSSSLYLLKQVWGQRLKSGILILSMFYTSFGIAQQDPGSSNMFSMEVDIDQAVGEMYPMWAYFGYDEPNYTYMSDGRKIISELADLSPRTGFLSYT